MFESLFEVDRPLTHDVITADLIRPGKMCATLADDIVSIAKPIRNV